MIDLLDELDKLPHDTHRYCKKCKEIKPITEFVKYNRKEGKGFRYRCKVCLSKSYSDFYYRHGKSEYHRKRKYNITSGQFLELVQNQNHKCKICGGKLDMGRKTHVDHNHTSGKIRGILCHTCNTALGHYEKYGSLFKKYLSNDQEYVKLNYKEFIPSYAFLN